MMPFLSKAPQDRENDESTEVDKRNTIEQLRQLMENDEKLKNLQSGDDYLMRFLYSCDFDVEAAFNRMKDYYELLLEVPDWFTKDGPLKRKWLIEKDVRIMTSLRDKEGRPLYICRIGNTNFSTMNLLDLLSVDDIWMEYIANDLGVKEHGLSVIIDLKGVSWKIMKWMTPQNIKTGQRKLNSHPLKDYRFHVVNSVFFVNTLVKIVWPFLNERIKEMIKFHFTDWNSLHQHIDSDKLPPEYGGKTSLNVEECYLNLFEKNNEIVENFLKNRPLCLS